MISEFLRACWVLLALTVLTVALGLPTFLVILFKPDASVTSRAARLWGIGSLRALGARVRYSGLEHVDARLPCIFVSNHQSNADIWVLLRVAPPGTRFVAKESLFRVPVLGWVMARGGFIPIDRQDRHRAIRSLEAAARKVRAGTPLVVFPEGTRARDGRLAPFKKGPFHLAIKAGVPIVPVAISGSGKLLPPGRWRARSGEIRVRFLPPVDLDADERPAVLAERTREAIATALDDV